MGDFQGDEKIKPEISGFIDRLPADYSAE